MKVSTDQFLQRFKSNHNLSLYSKSRYLNRSVYEIEFSNLRGAIPISAGFQDNKRVTVLESPISIDWATFYLDFQLKSFTISNHFIRYEDEIFYDYDLSLNKKAKSLNIFLSKRTSHFLLHPYYLHNHGDLSNNKFYKISYNKGVIEWHGLSSIIGLEVSHATDQQKLGMESLAKKNRYSSIMITILKKLNSIMDASINYNIMDTKNYYSGGIGNQIALKIQSQFQLFDNFMKLELDLEGKHFFNRVNYSMINPIEMVPIVLTKNDHRSLKPANLINANLRAKVSTVLLEFKWINLSEIILSSSQLKKNNLILIHPNMPYLGGQINFSIIWEFQD